jgi:DtxR family Mn-dependent transcriptional regulator
MPNPGEHHPAFEEYCECIFELREDNLDVIQARIADRLRVSRPSVSEMIKRLIEERLILVTDGHITLTDSGEELAQRVVRRHRIAERFMTDILGLSWALAHREAGRWEHVMSDAVEEAMRQKLGNPTTCPHGNPIPGSGYAAPPAVSLSKLNTGQSFTVSRIPEELEFSPGMLEF